ncbi:hypothetical protein AB6A40_005674 [Gnathostoma spinigerum]|uniref:Uncharacterized protein n=1 Tax=Gnathostoma spinigerum TaxID=75299 RepID=A0ABD6EG43_9BILA
MWYGVVKLKKFEDLEKLDIVMSLVRLSYRYIQKLIELFFSDVGKSQHGFSTRRCKIVITKMSYCIHLYSEAFLFRWVLQ